MLRIKKFALPSLILFVSLLAIFSPSQGSDTNPRFRSSQTYVDRSYGFTIALSKGFRLSSEQGDLLFFRSLNRPGTIIIRPRSGLSLSTVQAAIRNGFDDEAIQLTPSGPPITLELEGGRGLARKVEGTLDGQAVSGILAGVFGPYDLGYMILVGSLREKWPGFTYEATQMLESLVITRPQPGFEFERWQQRLKGGRFVFVEAHGTRFAGATHIAEYHFCSDGSFFQKTETMSSSGNGWSLTSHVTTSKSRGTWQVRLDNNNPLLIMGHRRGPKETIRIAESGGHVLLNNLPYEFALNELCN